MLSFETCLGLEIDFTVLGLESSVLGIVSSGFGLGLSLGLRGLE